MIFSKLKGLTNKLIKNPLKNNDLHRTYTKYKIHNYILSPQVPMKLKVKQPEILENCEAWPWIVVPTFLIVQLWSLRGKDPGQNLEPIQSRKPKVDRIMQIELEEGKRKLEGSL